MEARRMRYTGVLAVLLIVSGCGGGGAGNAREVSRQDLGSDWPLTVDRGTLKCEGSRGVGQATITVNGTTYYVNGLAKQTNKYRPLEEIWAPNPSIPGARMDAGKLTELALALCK